MPSPNIETWNSPCYSNNDINHDTLLSQCPNNSQLSVPTLSDIQESSPLSIVPLEIQDEILMGLAKCKSLEYFLLRRIREKCRHFAKSECRQNRDMTSIETLVKEYSCLSSQQISNPSLLTAFQPLLDNYTNIFQRSLM